MPNRPSSFICSTIAVGELVGVLQLGRDGDHLAGDEAAHGLDHLLADLGVGRHSHAAHATRSIAEHAPNRTGSGGRYRTKPMMH